MLVILCFTNASFNSENPELLNNSNSGCVDGSYKRMAQNETIISLGCINFLPTYNWYGHVAGTQGERNDEQLHVVVSESALDVEDMTYCNDAFPSIYIYELLMSPWKLPQFRFALISVALELIILLICTLLFHLSCVCIQTGLNLIVFVLVYIYRHIHTRSEKPRAFFYSILSLYGDEMAW